MSLNGKNAVLLDSLVIVLVPTILNNVEAPWGRRRQGVASSHFTFNGSPHGLLGDASARPPAILCRALLCVLCFHSGVRVERIIRLVGGANQMSIVTRNQMPKSFHWTTPAAVPMTSIMMRTRMAAAFVQMSQRRAAAVVCERNAEMRATTAAMTMTRAGMKSVAVPRSKWDPNQTIQRSPTTIGVGNDQGGSSKYGVQTIACNTATITTGILMLRFISVYTTEY